MSENSNRRKFLQVLGITAGSAIVNLPAVAGLNKQETVYKLNPEQLEFMTRYGEWMDEFIDVIRIQKTDRNNSENNARMISLTERAETFKPDIAKFMQDEKFALIYTASIQRMSNEI